ncbi:hypothetical protein RMATCC62417_03353 [Rhizopus microsporus]|nr:hypothetical protein RMATCC62417_03353 [Rhizopus microsporus]
MNKRGKKTPCEGCRERKKKCTGELPCERCQKLGTKCHYLQPVAVPNADHIRDVDYYQLQLQVDALKDVLTNMEHNLCAIRQKARIKDNNDKSTNDTKDDVNWQLTINNGSISIHTDIKTYAGLLQSIQTIAAKHFSLTTQTILNDHIEFIQRQKLPSKLRTGAFLAVLKCIEMNKQGQLATITYASRSNSYPLQNIIPQLMRIYFSCQFLRRVVFHQHTFFKMFIKSTDKLSPVVYALCATVLSERCRHITKLFASQERIILGERFYDKARELIEVKFDEIGLETMMTFTFLATYKANLLYPQEAKMYLEMAMRIRQILAETTYKDPNLCDKGEYITFKRQGVALQYVITVLQYINNKRGMPVEIKSDRNVENRKPDNMKKYEYSVEYDATVLPDEPPAVVRSIAERRCLNLIGKVMSPYYRRVRHGVDDNIPVSLIMKTEEELKKLYFQKVDPDYRLPMSIFNEDLDDLEFKRRLDNCSQCSIHSVCLAALFYQSHIGLYEPYLPNLQGNGSQTDSLLDYTPTEYSSPQVNYNILKLHAHQVCFKSARIVVRLLEYLCNVLDACNVNLGILMCAWEIHRRNACLDMNDDELAKSDVYTYLSTDEINISRAYMFRCVQILKRGYMFNQTERSSWEFFKKSEQQMMEALCISPQPTAEYWEPARPF